MTERIEDWWARRQFSRGRAVPYDVGTYHDAWASYPMLVRQYHPELNAGIVLSQIPPAADVLLLWQCEAGHLFVATPTEQRERPEGRRRRSAWCPDCTAGAVQQRFAPARARSPDAPQPRAPRRKQVCPKTPDVPVGTAFVSTCAPKPASAAEEKIRAALFGTLAVTGGMNAVRVSRPFFEHLEVWPDMLLPELRVAVEYDTTGKFGLEHVGQREETDRRKDRLLRAAGWEVVRLRAGALPPLGPHDITGATTSRRTVERLIEALRDIRGPLMVDAYRV
ncbi:MULTISPECIES: hypothetical protein [unclassified Microbacterium]|uniref:zinc-ribbon domain-containing protein n=1 Tax=unclassified Microbacterium TaxID=2609290 RepID=UPI00214C9F9D|nr:MULTISPECIES: hypothetical protein [unclassified Microbacterium]MCR2784004.1 hypothetical protein [Microbacterium sp. zg.B96]WIM15153.1 hypothetical protein QNO11_11440 [Microbacterium sp. zg-B96]